MASSPTCTSPLFRRPSTTCCRLLGSRLSLFLPICLRRSSPASCRSKEPSSILGVARTVVTNVEKINGDVQAVDQRQLSTFSHDDQDQLESLKANVNATLSNLMTASKNHATSFGVSPVSLVDAAASHLANTVVDLVRLLKIRRTTAGGGGGGGGRIAHDPMPPLAESPASPPPPMPPSKPNGYLSGGIGSVKSALGAIGLGGQARDRDSKEVASVASPTPSYQQQQQQQQNATSNVRSPAAQSEYSVRGGYGGASSVQSPEGHSWEQDSRQGPAHAMHSSSNSREEESYRRAASPQQQRGYGAGGDASSISSFGRGQTSLRNGNGNGAEEREREVRRYDSSSPVMQQREQQQQQQTSALGNYSSSDGGGSYGYGQQPEGPYQGQYGANGGYSQDDDEQEERRDDGLENNAEELKVRFARARTRTSLTNHLDVRHRPTSRTKRKPSSTLSNPSSRPSAPEPKASNSTRTSPKSSPSSRPSWPSLATPSPLRPATKATTFCAT